MDMDMNKRIVAHGEKLNKIFDTHVPPITLCKKLRYLEVIAHRNSEDYCNGVINAAIYDRKEQAVLKRLNSILDFKKKKIPVFINSDPRGYALKIKSEWIRVNQSVTLPIDLGGYGLIAPDLR